MRRRYGKLRGRVGRGRRVVGWVLVVAGVVVAGIWGASRWWSGGYNGSRLGFFVDHGVVGISVLDGPRPEWGPWGWFRIRDVSGPNSCYWMIPEPDPWRFSVHLWIAGYYKSDYSSIIMSNNQVMVSRWEYSAQVVPWPFALVCLVSGGLLVRSGRRVNRRAMQGRCLKCGYDLAGLGDGVRCPECAGERV